MVSFIEIIQSAEAMGLTAVLLPFTLIFALVYAILSVVKPFGQYGKNYNIILALIMGLLVVVPHVTGTYPPGADVVEIINSALPNVSLVIVALVMVLILLGVFGLQLNLDEEGGLAKGVIPFLALIVVAFIFGRSAGWFDFGLPNWLGFLDDPDVLSVILVVLVFVIIIAFVTGGGQQPKNRLSGMFKEFGNMFKKV